MCRHVVWMLCLLSFCSPAGAADEALTAEEARQLMRRLAQYVYDHHLKQDPRSEQRGMVYEYFDVSRKGAFDQWVQGEALDTMHDGAWLAVALVNAFRATGDPFYKEFLARWQMPFYTKVLNQSDTLFSARRNDAGPKAHRFDKEHQLQEGEKGFCPYWWDDGASVSLERRRQKTPLGVFACTDRLAGKPNPRYLLDGYSHGSSNHLAQDLAVMLQQAWLLCRPSPDAAEQRLAAEIALAARHLHGCRMRHHGAIPAVVAAAGLTNRDPDLLRRVPELREWAPSNHYTRALLATDPKQRHALPGFADDQQYRYYAAIARAGGELPRPVALSLIYDAFTEPMLFRYWSDNAPVPPGINRFDLAPFYCQGGKLVSYRSDRVGPIGSRMGPQNMVVCGWALQALRAYPGLWDERHRTQFADDLRVRFLEDESAYTPGLQSHPEASEPVQLGPAKLRLVSHRSALIVQGTAVNNTTLRIYAQPDARGPHAEVTLTASGGSRAVNNAGEALQLPIFLIANGEHLRFEFALPYTIVKGQKPWANGVEHGRYSLAVGEARRNLYLASSEEHVRKALLRELAGGLRTWEKLFAEKGYIPTGMGAGAEWDRFSDSGGYAHLLSAAAQYLLYLDGRYDWQLHQVPR